MIGVDVGRVQARLSDPETSKDAAADIDGLAAAEKVFLTILRSGPRGATCAEITEVLLERYNMPSQSISSTCSRLWQAGYVFNSGETREGNYGKKQIVWIAEEFWDLM
jgi:hypothetical protein